jgi:hypothetical protein
VEPLDTNAEMTLLHLFGSQRGLRPKTRSERAEPIIEIGTIWSAIRFSSTSGRLHGRAGPNDWRRPMNGLIYLVGLIVVVMAVLSLLGLR